MKLSENNPIFIFSAGWRSGSTLLQRLITSSGQVLIWGEAGGALNCLAEAYSRYKQMVGPGSSLYPYGYGGNGAEQYYNFMNAGRNGVQKWIACMNPPIESIYGVFLEFFDSYYGSPLKKMGYERWGLKEVQSGIATANFLKEIFPNAKFLFVVRNPISCLRSIKMRNWMDRKNYKDGLIFYSNVWKKLSSEFSTANFGMLIRYEDLISKSALIAELENYLCVGNLSKNFVKDSHVDWKPMTLNNLTILEKIYLKTKLRPQMKLYGYD
jgi:hypothetical protein